MHSSIRRAARSLLRSGAFTATATHDLGPGAMDGYDALLIHYVVTNYATGNVTIKVSAIADAPGSRILACDNSAWTTSAISANAQGTLIVNAPLPSDILVTLTGASTPGMSLAVYVEKVKTGH